MLRIALIITIVTGLAALGISQLKVSKKIQTLTQERNDLEQQKITAVNAEAKAKRERQQAVEAKEQLEQQMSEANMRLEQLSAEAAQQRKRADQLQADLTQTTEQRNLAQTELASFRAIGLTAEQILQLNNELRNARQERDAFAAENTILSRNLNQLQLEIARYRGEIKEVPLPAGLKGKVIAVDPKYNFVVLDIGTEQEVVEHGKMMVMRDGKLVAKVEITKVQPKQSIANILPGWQQAEVMEGDTVIY